MASSQSTQTNEPMSTRTKSEISLEYAALRNKNHCPSGMYIIPTVEAFSVWCGVLFVHQGNYNRIECLLQYDSNNLV